MPFRGIVAYELRLSLHSHSSCTQQPALSSSHRSANPLHYYSTAPQMYGSCLW